MQLNLFERYEESTACESVPVVAVDLDEHLALMQAWMTNRTDALTVQLRAIDEHRRSWWPHYPL